MCVRYNPPNETAGRLLTPPRDDTGGIKMIPFRCHFSGASIEKTIVYVKELIEFHKKVSFRYQISDKILIFT
jgi:hypothetical protein